MPGGFSVRRENREVEIVPECGGEPVPAGFGIMRRKSECSRQRMEAIVHSGERIDL